MSEICECCGRKAELNEDGECPSCEADINYSIDDYMKESGTSGREGGATK